MTPIEYQIKVRRTAKSDDPRDQRILNWALGLTGEAGEVANKIKKQTFHGHGENADEIADEVGDVLWYVAMLLDEYGYNLEQVMLQNIHKLEQRYPERFDPERSRFRV